MDGKEKVLQKFDSYGEKKTHWKIYYGYSPLPGNLVGSTELYTDKALDKALSRDKLESELELLEPGEYLVQFKDTASASTNIISTRFKIGYEPAHQPAQQQNSMRGYMSPDIMNMMLEAKVGKISAEFEKKLADTRMAHELAKMQDQIKELKKGVGKGSNEIVDGIKEIIGFARGLSGMTALTPATAKPIVIKGPQQTPQQTPPVTTTTPTTEQQPPTEEEQKRMAYFMNLYNTAMQELAAAEGGGLPGSENLTILLWCMNEYRKANPTQWEALKPVVLEYQKQLPGLTDNGDGTYTLKTS